MKTQCEKTFNALLMALVFAVSILPSATASAILLHGTTYDKTVYPSAEEIRPFVLPLIVVLCVAAGIVGMLLTSRWLNVLDNPEPIRPAGWRLHICRIISIVVLVLMGLALVYYYVDVWFEVVLILMALIILLSWSCHSAASWAYGAFLSFSVYVTCEFIVSSVWILGDDLVDLMFHMPIWYFFLFVFGCVFMRVVIVRQSQKLGRGAQGRV